MAKLGFYEINCAKYVIDNEEIVNDSVIIQIFKRVNNSTMSGEKGEEYKVPITDLPYLFNKDIHFPGMAGSDCTARIAAVKKFLDPYVGKDCTAEEVSRNSRKTLTSIEFK